jgi:hypothetical protein
MNKYIFSKGRHTLEVQEIDNLARIEGLKGWADFFAVYQMLMDNGYSIIK